MSLPSYSRVERSVKRIERLKEKKKEKLSSATSISRTNLESLFDTIHFDVSMMLPLLFFIAFYAYFVVKITGDTVFLAKDCTVSLLNNSMRQA